MKRERCLCKCWFSFILSFLYEFMLSCNDSNPEKDYYLMGLYLNCDMDCVSSTSYGSHLPILHIGRTEIISHISDANWTCDSLLLFQLDIAVLQFQNQKLMQKLETQKLEYTALENKFSQLKGRQQSYDSTLAVVKKNWEQVIWFPFHFVFLKLKCWIL